MDIKELTEAMHRFVASQGWYGADSPRPQTLRNLAISLNLEAGEVLEHFQWGETPAEKEAFAAELADVLLYLMQLASLSEVDLEKAVLKKLDKNYRRTWDTPKAAAETSAPTVPPVPASSEAQHAAGILEEPRPWPFSRSELAGGLRRYAGDSSLTIKGINELEIPDQRPSRGRVRGLLVRCDTAAGAKDFRLVLKEPQGITRAGTASAGWREVSLYTQLSDQIPLCVPTLIAAGSEGEWIVLGMLESSRPPEQWQREDYALAIDQLVGLHDRFWGQGESLSTYPWLARPFSADLDIYRHVATSGLAHLQGTPTSLFHQDPNLMQMFELLAGRIDTIAAELLQAPATLLHGDYWPGNLLIYPDRRLFAIDWQRAGIGPGTLDLFNFIQSSLWWFEKLPIEPAQITLRYRQGMQVASGQQWNDQEWERLWDFTLLWTFLSDWLDLLANIPNPILKTRWAQLESVWLEPLRKAAHRHLLK